MAWAPNPPPPVLPSLSRLLLSSHTSIFFLESDSHQHSTQRTYPSNSCTKRGTIPPSFQSSGTAKEHLAYPFNHTTIFFYLSQPTSNSSAFSTSCMFISFTSLFIHIPRNISQTNRLTIASSCLPHRNILPTVLHSLIPVHQYSPSYILKISIDYLLCLFINLSYSNSVCTSMFVNMCFLNTLSQI